jgi:hypothetical protein
VDASQCLVEEIYRKKMAFVPGPGMAAKPRSCGDGELLLPYEH